MMRMISIIVPCYNEEEIIENSLNEIKKNVEKIDIDYEIIIVDDGSNDDTYRIIKKIAEENDKVKGIRFTRNFGKEAAIYAGMVKAKGEGVVVMDVDLQHPPHFLSGFIKYWSEEKYDIVEVVKSNSYDGRKRGKIRSAIFNYLFSKFAGFKMYGSSDFKLLDRKVVNAIIALPEKTRLFRGLTTWSGFKTKKIDYNVPKRLGGKTKWSSISLLKLFVSSITAFSNFPLHIITTLGAITLIFSFLLSIQTLYNKLIGKAVAGFTSVIILLLLLNSVIMISIGIIGIYLANIYTEIKGRPLFIVKEETNLDDEFTE